MFKKISYLEPSTVPKPEITGESSIVAIIVQGGAYVDQPTALSGYLAGPGGSCRTISGFFWIENRSFRSGLRSIRHSYPNGGHRNLVTDMHKHKIE